MNLPVVLLTTVNQADVWNPLLGREVQINKASSTSKLRITYQDTLGARASNQGGCLWRIIAGGNVVSTFTDADLQLSAWRMHNAAHMAWALDLPAGLQSVRVESRRTPAATDCLSGWNTTGNFLSVEEIP
jgi:hypothetical protein